MSFKPNEDGFLHATNKRVEDNEIIQVCLLSKKMILSLKYMYSNYPKVRTNRERDKIVDFTPAEDKKEAGECEISYVYAF